MINLKKYNENNFEIPAVVDFIDYFQHGVIDIIQLKGEQFKKNDKIGYNGISFEVIKILKKYPIQTEYKIENKLYILKVRYFCNKL